MTHRKKPDGITEILLDRIAAAKLLCFDDICLENAEEQQMKKAVLVLILALMVAAIAGYTTASYTVTFTDPSQDDRQIPVVIYYPAELTGGTESAPYIVFGHGWMMNHSMYGTLTDALIDLGWIVVYPRTEESMFPNHISFVQDLSFLCAAALTEHDNVNSILYNCIAEPAVVMGHSMGGGAAVLAAGMENEFAALVTFCAAETDVSAIAGAADVTLPAVTLSGSADTIAPPAQHQVPMYENLASEYKCYVSITGAGHLNLYNNALIPQLLAPWLDYVRSTDYSYIQAFEEVLTQNSEALSYQIDDSLVVSAPDESNPAEALRLANFPNPFNPRTTVSFDLPATGKVKIEIFNARGQQVCTLADGYLTAGKHWVTWDGMNGSRSEVAGGVYYCRLQSSRGQTQHKMVLLK